MAQSASYEQIDRVIRGFYDAALEPAGWQRALDELCDLLGISAAGMSLQSKSLGPRHLSYSRLDLEYIKVMGEQYPTADKNPMISAMAKIPAATVVSRRDICSETTYCASGLYNDVFRPQGLSHVGVGCAHRSEDAFVPLGLFSDSPGKEFNRHQREMLRIVLPHLDRALQIYVRITMAEASQACAESALEALPFGVLLLDIKGQVWNSNREAEAILRGDHGLTVRRGQLHAALPGEDRALQTIIRSALGVASGAGLGAGGRLGVSRPATPSPLTVLVAPLPVSLEMGRPRPGAVVFVSDPEASLTPNAAGLMELFDLTPAQSKLASLLARGLDIQEAAHRLGITPGTVRNHLKAIFQKTGATRQPELVRQVLASVASLSADALVDER